MGSRDAGALHDLPWDPAVVASPRPPNLDTPLLVTPESPVWTVRFSLQWVHHRLLGAGWWVWVDEGGVAHLDRPPRLGVVNGWWGWQPELPGPGKRWSEVRPPPPPEMGSKMFELAQTNIFIPGRKKGLGTHWRFVTNCWQGLGLGGIEYAGKAWTSTPTWLGLSDFGSFNPEAAKRGAYAGVVHGIACRPKSKPKPAATPVGGPPQPHPPNPRDPFAKALGAISPALDRQGTAC